MHKDVIEQIICSWKIVYVSCNSATQARDLWWMKYKVTRVRPRYVPQTHHVENVVLLEKIGLSLEVKSLPYWNLILLLSLEFGLLKLDCTFMKKIILLLFVIVYSFSVVRRWYLWCQYGYHFPLSDFVLWCHEFSYFKKM
jgi:hypothetical protein